MSASAALLKRIYETPKTGTKSSTQAWAQNSEPRFLRCFTDSAITRSFMQKCTAAFVELPCIDFHISSPKPYFDGSSKRTPNYRTQRTRSARR
jgi:hypothetical protein